MRTYNRKTQNGTIPPEVMRQAVQKVQEGGKFTTIACEIGIPHSNLKHNAQKFSEEGCTSATNVMLDQFVTQYKTHSFHGWTREKS